MSDNSDAVTTTPGGSTSTISSDPTRLAASERLVAVLLIFVGLGLRTQLTRSPLWLDEAQSVAVAELGWGSIIDGLRADGHPPLYYWILNGWMTIFGHSDASVRALSGLFGLAAIVAMGMIGRRLGGERLMWMTMALAAVSPFMVRYGTEVRMYSLVTLLVAVWWLAIDRHHLPLVAVMTAALALTHYWALFLFAAWLLTGGWRDRRLLMAHLVGGVAFLAWVPHLLYQLEHTGTPWAGAPGPRSLILQTLDAVGYSTMAGVMFGLLVVLGLRHREMWPLGWLSVVAFVIAVATLLVADTAFAGRYLAVVVPFGLVVAARGIDHVSVLAFAGVALAVGGWFSVSDIRSQGQEVAAVLNETALNETVLNDADAGGLAVSCPDQIGPSISRYSQPRVLAYPRLTDASRVDWVDYAERHASSDPFAVADTLVEMAEGRPIFLAWREGYLTLGTQCTDLYHALSGRMQEPVPLVFASPEVFEPMRLDRFDAP